MALAADGYGIGARISAPIAPTKTTPFVSGLTTLISGAIAKTTTTKTTTSSSGYVGALAYSGIGATYCQNTKTGETYIRYSGEPARANEKILGYKTIYTYGKTSQEINNALNSWISGLNKALGIQTTGGSTGGGGGSRSYSYSSSADTSVKFPDNIEELFRAVIGRPPSANERKNYAGKSQYTILQYLVNLPEFSELSPGYSAIASPYQTLWQDMIDNDIALPASEIKNWIINNWSADQVKQRIRDLPVWTDGREYKNISVHFDDTWDELTGDSLGAKMTADDIARRDWLIKNGATVQEWEDYIKTTTQYKTGSTYLSIKQEVIEVLYESWGRATVDTLIRGNPNYIEEVVWPALGGDTASAAKISAWARTKTEYWLNGPEAASTRENLRRLYSTIMRVAPEEAWLDQYLLLGITPAQLLEQLRGTQEYQALYEFKPAWMQEEEWISTVQAFNAVGRWYFGGAGEKQYYSDADIAQMRAQLGFTEDQVPPGVYQEEDGRYYSYIGASWDYTSQQIRDWVDAGVSPEELHNYYIWTEDAWANLPTMNELGEAIGRVYSYDDAFSYISNGEGSGRIRAELQQAQKRRTFDDAFFLYNGRMPTLEDYEMLENTYPSANVYGQVMAAHEYALSEFDSVDELLMRVYGEHADMGMLEDLALGAENSGLYKAKLQLATELDRYRWEWKSYFKVEPTPDDYARFANYAGVEELSKELRVRELVTQRGPSVKNAYNDYWVPLGYEPMDDDDVETLVGEYQGYGAVEARLQIAEDHQSQWRQAREQAFYYGAAYSPVAYPEFGGVMLPAMRSIRI